VRAAFGVEREERRLAWLAAADGGRAAAAAASETSSSRRGLVAAASSSSSRRGLAAAAARGRRAAPAAAAARGAAGAAEPRRRGGQRERREASREETRSTAEAAAGREPWVPRREAEAVVTRAAPCEQSAVPAGHGRQAASSKADPKRKQDWSFECLRGGASPSSRSILHWTALLGTGTLGRGSGLGTAPASHRWFRRREESARRRGERHPSGRAHGASGGWTGCQLRGMCQLGVARRRQRARRNERWRWGWGGPHGPGGELSRRDELVALVVGGPLGGVRRVGGGGGGLLRCTPYGDEKVANRDSRVWHGATEKGP
jgi:hypothetical protein